MYTILRITSLVRVVLPLCETSFIVITALDRQCTY